MKEPARDFRDASTGASAGSSGSGRRRSSERSTGAEICTLHYISSSAQIRDIRSQHTNMLPMSLRALKRALTAMHHGYETYTRNVVSSCVNRSLRSRRVLISLPLGSSHNSSPKARPNLCLQCSNAPLALLHCTGVAHRLQQEYVTCHNRTWSESPAEHV